MVYENDEIINARNNYVILSDVTNKLENYLKKELGKDYKDSGECKDFDNALDKFEELFKFVIISMERNQSEE